MPIPRLTSLTEAELRRLFLQFWTRGQVLSDGLESQALFPVGLRFKLPTSADWRQDLILLQARCRELEALSEQAPIRITWEQVSTPVGRQRTPIRIEISSRQDYLTWLGLRAEYERFVSLSTLILDTFPALRPWLSRFPLKVLQQSDLTWRQLLSVCSCLQEQPRPGVYLRELALPGIDTKFIENHQGLLRELLDMLLPSDAIDSSVTALSGQGFARRYGLRYDEALIRLRLLDPGLRFHPAISDISLTVSEFAQLSLPCQRVFICENKTPFLSFPNQALSIVVFSAGKAVELLTAAQWLQSVELWYWGDLDSHGFGILARLRKSFPHLHSLLMDLPTLLSYRQDWVQEDTPASVETRLLTSLEQAACLALQNQSDSPHIRLEQEKISQLDVQKHLLTLPDWNRMN